MPHTRFERRFGHPFVIKEGDIEKLCRVLTGHVGNLRISITCSDYARREYEDMNALLGYENGRGRRINGIFLSASSANSGAMSAEVWLFDEFISVKISGPDRESSELKDLLFEIIDGIRPWHYWISGMGEFVLFLICNGIFNFLFFVLPMVNFVLPMLNGGTTYWLERVPDHWSLGLLIFVIFCWIYICAAVLKRGIKQLFPFAEFIIGQEKQRYESREWARKAAVVGTISVISGGAIWHVLL